MPVFPVEWQPVLRTGAYPHMAKLDAAIWERFLDAYGVNFTAVSYDVALGGFLPDETAGTFDQRKGWQYSTALKIDAVAQREGEVWIIEVKPGAGTSALGATISYTILAEHDPFSPFPLVPAVVTDRSTPDIRFCAEQLGVTLVEMGDGSGLPLPSPFAIPTRVEIAPTQLAGPPAAGKVAPPVYRFPTIYRTS